MCFCFLLAQALSYRDVDTAYSRQISLEAARQMIVLLQNEGSILPLSTVSGNLVEARVSGSDVAS